jgi:hypothetical protein
LLQAAAEQGDGPAQLNLGNMYRSGEGVVRDDIKAAEYFRKAADQGYAIAQNNLGSMYARGEGVSQDYAQGGVVPQGGRTGRCRIATFAWRVIQAWCWSPSGLRAGVQMAYCR